MWKRLLPVLAAAASMAPAPQEDPLSILLFTKATEYRHASIPDAIEAIEAIGGRRGWKVETTEDASRFKDEELEKYDVVVFLMTTGDVLDQLQEAAFERFIRSGKGYVGVHSAADTGRGWPWYRGLVGAYFLSHPEIQEATYVVEDDLHPATADLPLRWRRVDEHYNFGRNPRPDVNVLITLDEASYDPGEDAMGDHPIAWYQEYEGGRAFYTGLGHTSASWQEELFLEHLAGGIFWAAG